MAPRRKVVKPTLTEAQLAFKSELTAINNAVKLLQKQLRDKHSQCPHAIAYEVDNTTWCELCGEDFGWHCPKSPDHACHYYSERQAPGMELIVKLNNGATAYLPSDYDGDYETDDCCIFCHDPQERK